MSSATHTTNEIPFVFHGMRCYRIEIINDNVRPMQRHVWTRADGSVDVQPWIRGFHCEPKALEQGRWMEVR